MAFWRGVVFALSLAFTPVFAQAQIIETDAAYAVIMDHETGEILWSKDAYPDGSGFDDQDDDGLFRLRFDRTGRDHAGRHNRSERRCLAPGRISIWRIDHGIAPKRAPNRRAIAARIDHYVRQ